MNKLTYIDDCQLDHFILRKLLSRFGFPTDVRCTGSGARVLEQLSQNRQDGSNLPDIILLDIAYTPGFDAWDFLDQLQTLHPQLSKPIDVYILSASKYSWDIEHLKKYPFVRAFIQKPITKEVLLKLISQKELSGSRYATIEALN